MTTFASTLDTLIPARDAYHAQRMIDTVAADLSADASGMANVAEKPKVYELAGILSDADISFMGTLPVVIAEREVGAVPILAEVYRGHPSYRARIFVRRDSGIKTLADLKGRSIAFADLISESGYLYPAMMFYDAGLVQKGAAFFSDVFFRRRLSAVGAGPGQRPRRRRRLQPVRRASHDARAAGRGRREQGDIPSHAVIARPGLSGEVREKFVKAMLKLNEPKYQHLLQHVYSPDGYGRADPATFEPVRQLAEKRGIM